MWWRGIDKNIASTVHSCLSCQSVRNKPPQATLQPWDWQRVHIDFAVPFMNKMLKVVVDCHSKWLEVDIMPDVTRETTIEQLCNLFARFRIPECLVSDKGAQFSSREFAEFTKRNGIKQILVAPYHPRSNWQAKRFVQKLKQFFKVQENASALLTHSLAPISFQLPYYAKQHNRPDTS